MENDELKHLALSILHGTFNDNDTGGCSCSICSQIINLMLDLQKEEAAKFYDEHYPPVGGFL